MGCEPWSRDRQLGNAHARPLDPLGAASRRPAAAAGPAGRRVLDESLPALPQSRVGNALAESGPTGRVLAFLVSAPLALVRGIGGPLHCRSAARRGGGVGHGGHRLTERSPRVPCPRAPTAGDLEGALRLSVPQR